MRNIAAGLPAHVGAVEASRDLRNAAVVNVGPVDRFLLAAAAEAAGQDE